MDSRDRDKFYSSKSTDDDDDDYELEVEPPDAEVTAAQERQANEAIEASKATIDIDEIYRDTARERSDEILQNWFKDFKWQFRFQVRHLLIATAVIAIILTLGKLQMLGTVMVIGIMITVAGLFFYLQWQEHKAQEEATRRRQEMYARRRAQMTKMSGGSATAKAPLPATPPPVEEIAAEAPAPTKFRLQYSMSQLMIAMTVSAVIFGMVSIFGGSSAATLLGFVALIGLVIHALGVEPPQVVVLGWWFILVLYVLLSISTALWHSIA